VLDRKENLMNPVRKIVIGGAVAGAALLGVAVGATSLGTASAASDTPSTSTPVATSGSSATSTDGSEATETHGPHEANGVTETALTGDDLATATAAAQAAVPGATIDRVETDADGATYEAHMTKSDGSEVTVKIDANFAVTGTESSGGGHHGGGRHGDETALSGDELATATAAAQAAVPGATIDRVETDADGATYEAHMTKSDGSEVTVKMDANFAVTGTVDGHG
jgi:uncharacterized membrane protein YkoI